MHAKFIHLLMLALEIFYWAGLDSLVLLGWQFASR